MSGSGWLSLLEELARAAGSERCLAYDACPHEGLLFNIDGYSAEHSKLPWMTWEDFGWKATVAAAADVIASGGTPRAVMYSVGVSSPSEALAIASGVGEAAHRLGALVLKADTNRAREPWIDVAVVGDTGRPVGRRGARPGDYLVQVGLVGYGLVAELVLRGEASVEDAGRLLDYTRRPFLDPGLGRLISACNASAASDNSDGWAFTISTLLDQRLDAEVDSIEAPSRVLDFIAGHYEDPEIALFDSKEDYTIAVAAGDEASACILEGCKRLGAPCSVVGRMVEGSGRIKYGGVEVRVEGWEWF
ncbi:MAG: AIR synthase related protein [Desulfurococcales archaeon]|nr:AIR synthase related protein [Desulfurococcales archaeon]